MAKEFSQMPGINFTEISSPLAKHSTLRMMIALSIKYCWQISSIYVKNAFVNADFSEGI